MKKVISTQNKGSIDLINPKVEYVDINDIAHSLGNMCRFGGHTPHFYSVAEHSLITCELCPEEYQKMALLYDATKTYVMDLLTPIKDYIQQFNHLESKWFEVIIQKFDLNREHIEYVKKYDQQATHIEYARFFNNKHSNLIKFLHPKDAEDRFLQHYESIRYYVDYW
jgi:5'-deoxynucleotidase YfbR-like HD superfamily hydrolase